MHFGTGRRRCALTLAVAVALAAFGASPAAHAESNNTTTGDDAARIRTLEQENAAFRKELEGQRLLLEDLKNSVRRNRPAVSASAEGGSSPITSKFPIELSGFLKTDMLWNNARLNSTSAPRFVLSERPSRRPDDQFTATIQHSRLIARIGEVEIGRGATILGHLEMDFFNLADSGDTNFANNQLRVRQLYTELKLNGWTVLAGQAWDLFSPLNVPTLNTNGNYWFGGNAGFRRPQLRVSRSLEMAPGHSLNLAASVSSNLGVAVTAGGRTLNSGRDAGIPVLQGRMEYSFPGLEQTAKVGVSGLWGQEDFDGLAGNVDQWAIAAHAVLPVTNWLSLSGEVHHGKNTDAFLTGGGVNSAGEGIGSTSGWAQATVKASDRLTFTGMAGFDDVSDSDIGAGARASNLVAGLSMKYRLYKPLTVGLEYDYFRTKYKSASNEDANMIWLSGIFHF